MVKPILLVEDDADDADLIRFSLQAAGIADPVIWIQSGEEALSYIEGVRADSNPRAQPDPSLILLDLNLPKVSGFEVLKRRRDCPELAGVPALVITGSVDSRDIDRAFELGAESYIVKPRSFADLVDTLRFKVNLCLHRSTSMNVDAS